MANAKVKYILELENKIRLASITKDVEQAANGFDALKAKIELSARTLTFLQRELTSMQAKFDTNNARIKELQAVLTTTAHTTEKETQETAKLRAELDRLIATNDKLANSIERKSISVQRSLNNLKALGQEANTTAKHLDKTADNVDQLSQKTGTNTSSMIGQIKGLVGSYLSLEAVTQAAAFAFDGFKLGAGIEQARLTVQTLSKDVEKGNKTFDAAIAFGQKYGYTQEEMASSVSQAIGIINNSTQSVEKSIETLARLASVNPTQGFEGAVVAMKELEGGDIVSIADRFNLGKDAARAMLDEIKAGKDPIVALDEALNKMGVTTDVLANRMKGSNGALLNAKLAAEDAKLAAGEFLTAIGAPEMLNNFATGLQFVNDKVREYIDLLNQSKGIDPATGQKQPTATSGLDASSYQEYQAQNQQFIESTMQADQAVRQRNLSLGSLGTALNVVNDIQRLFSDNTLDGATVDRTLTESEFGLAKAFVERGVAQDQAAAKAIQLNMATTATDNALGALTGTEAVTVEQSKALQDQIAALAMAHPAYTDQIFNTINAELEQGTTSQELTGVIEQLSDEIAYNQVELNRLEGAALLTAQATDVHAASVRDLTADEYDNIAANLEGQIQAENAAQLQHDLAIAYDMAGDGALGAGAATLFLADKYNLEASEVARLIALHNELIKARGGTAGNAAATALAGAVQYTEGRRSGRISAPYEPAKRGSGGSGRSSGSGSGKSEATKAAEREQKDIDKAQKSIEQATKNHQESMLDLERDYVADRLKIELDYIAKSIAAQQKFNRDKFTDQNSFKKGLIGVDPKLAKQALADEAMLWNESQTIAQTQGAAKADEFYKAGLELIQIRTENAEALAALDEQIASEQDAKELARLEFARKLAAETYAQDELLAQQHLDRIRAGEDKLKEEKAEAISENEQKYNEARSDIDTKFQESINKIVDGYDAVDEATTKTKDAIVAMAAAAMAELDRVRASAASSQTTASNTSQVDGSHATGLSFVPRDNYIARLHKGERVLTADQARRDDFLQRDATRQAQIDRAMNRGTSPTLATPRSSRTETINRSERTVHATISGSGQDIARGETTLRRIIREEIGRDAKLTITRVMTKKLR